MSNDELEYLRFVYNSLDLYTIINIYKNFNKLPPKEYFILLCKDCNNELATNICFTCYKYLCSHCTYKCKSTKLEYCYQHLLSCDICDNNCVCVGCRHYITDYTCDVCVENYGIFISCGCIIPIENQCMICNKKINNITKQII
jgi:hypothetical protein